MTVRQLDAGPHVNARRNDPSVDGPYAFAKSGPIPPWCSSSRSSIETELKPEVLQFC